MKPVENEQQLADELKAAFPNIYIHVRIERRAPRTKKIKTSGLIEICPGDEDDGSWDMISVQGENRFNLATNICKNLS